MAKKPNRPELQRPGQHEEQDRLLRQLLKGQSELAKAVGQSKPITVHFEWPMDHALMQKVEELLGITKDIQARLPAVDSATKEEIDAALGPAVGGLGTLANPTPEEPQT